MRSVLILLVLVSITALAYNWHDRDETLFEDGIYLGLRMNPVYSLTPRAYNRPGADVTELLPVGTQVYAYLPTGAVIPGVVTGVDSMSHPSGGMEDRRMCGVVDYLEPFKAYEGYDCFLWPPHIVSTIRPVVKMAPLPPKRPCELGYTVVTLLEDSLRSLMPELMRERFRMHNASDQDKAYEQIWEGAEVAEEFAFRSYTLPDGMALVFCAMKFTDAVPSEEYRLVHSWQSRIFGHELVGFLVDNQERSIISWFPVASFSWAGGDGSIFFQEASPREFIKESICGVVDVGHDESYEIIYRGAGLESSVYVIYRLTETGIVQIADEWAGGL